MISLPFGIPFEFLIAPALLLFSLVIYLREIRQAEARLVKVVEKVRRQSNASLKRLNKSQGKKEEPTLVMRLPGARELQRLLNVANLRISVLSLILAVAAAAVMTNNFIDQSLIPMLVSLYVSQSLGEVLSLIPIGLILSFLGFYQAAKKIVTILAERRLKKIREQLPQAIDGIARAMRVGRSFEGAITTIAESLPDPIGSEFKAATKLISIGGAPERALRSIANELKLEEFTLLVNTYAVHIETGGNLIEALDNLSESVRARLQLKGKIEAMVTEGKFSAYVIGALPFGVLGYFYLVNPSYIESLFTDTRGLGILVLSITMIFIGIAVLLRLTKVKV